MQVKIKVKERYYTMTENINTRQINGTQGKPAASTAKLEFYTTKDVAEKIITHILCSRDVLRTDFLYSAFDVSLSVLHTVKVNGSFKCVFSQTTITAKTKTARTEQENKQRKNPNATIIKHSCVNIIRIVSHY